MNFKKLRQNGENFYFVSVFYKNLKNWGLLLKIGITSWHECIQNSNLMKIQSISFKINIYSKNPLKRKTIINDKKSVRNV